MEDDDDDDDDVDDDDDMMVICELVKLWFLRRKQNGII